MNKANNVGEYFGTLQQSFVNVWRRHLTTHKYSAHIAMNEYYDDIVDTIDALVEEYQSRHGVLSRADFKNVIEDNDSFDDVAYLKDIREFVLDGRRFFTDEPELLSDIDAVLSVIDTAIYKLSTLTETQLRYNSLASYINESLVVNEAFHSSIMQSIASFIEKSKRYNTIFNLRGYGWDKITDDMFYVIENESDIKRTLRRGTNDSWLFVGFDASMNVSCMLMVQRSIPVCIMKMVSRNIYGEGFDIIGHKMVMEPVYMGRKPTQNDYVDVMFKFSTFVKALNLSESGVQDYEKVYARIEAKKDVIWNTVEQNAKIAEENNKRYKSQIAKKLLDNGEMNEVFARVSDMIQRIANKASEELKNGEIKYRWDLAELNKLSTELINTCAQMQYEAGGIKRAVSGSQNPIDYDAAAYFKTCASTIASLLVKAENILKFMK